MSAPRLKDDLFAGRYHVIRELGRGGMGTVELVYQIDLEREVALKRILPRYVGLASAEGWFKREYKALAAIRHPGVPAVHDCGRCDDLIPYFTMERIDGPSLADALKIRRFEAAEALTVAIELGRILAAAHAAGVVHRDVKPANIVLEAGGRVRLIDFGICFFLPKFKAQRNLRSVGEGEFETGPMEVAGSVGYTDPAILSGEYSPSVQSDVFSVCVVLYEMLTGRRLYDDKALAFRAIDSAEVAPELASAVVEIRRGSQFLPKDRHVSMDELIRALEIARTTVLRAQARPVKSAARGVGLGLSGVNLVILIALAISWTAGRIGPLPPAEVAAIELPAVEPAAGVELAAVELPAAGVESSDEVESAETVGSSAAVKSSDVVEPPAVERRAGKRGPVVTQPIPAPHETDDTRVLSQALVSTLAEDKLDALRDCVRPGEVTLELSAEAGHLRLLRVEWERYNPENGVHRCLARELDTIELPRSGPAGPYHLPVRN